MQSHQKKIIISVILGVCSVLLVVFPLKDLGSLDTKTQEYFQQSITKAGVSYATIRGINALVSVIKESSLELEPAGVGISLATGQLLDPIDDMTERVSDVLVVALSALGVEKLLYEITQGITSYVTAVILMLVVVWLWIPKSGVSLIVLQTIKVLLLIVLFRFALPASAYLNDFLNTHYFLPQITTTQEALDASSVAGSKELQNFKLPQSDGFFDSLKGSAAFVEAKVSAIKAAFLALVDQMEHIIANLLKLTYLYVGVFVIQVLLLPLGVFWFFRVMLETFFQDQRVKLKI